MPPQIDSLIENGQPYFGVFSQVQQINYLDYVSYRLSQKPMTQRQKQFKANQFAFIQIVHPPYRICVAIASIKLASTAFAYIYNEQTEQLNIVEGLQPLTHNVGLKGDHRNGSMTFKSKALDIVMDFEPEWVKLNLSSQEFVLNADFRRSNQPLSMCSPSGRRGWTFTNKEPLSLVDGTMTFIDGLATQHRDNDKNPSKNESSNVTFNDCTLANLDWTLGFMRHVTNWFWTCVNTTLPDKRQFMLNLSMGVNETGVSENACWIDDEIFYLPPVLFTRDANNSDVDTVQSNHQTEEGWWYIANQDLGWSKVNVELRFKPISVYKKHDNYGVVASVFEQWIGIYSGSIALEEQTINIENVIGLAEDHFAKW